MKGIRASQFAYQCLKVDWRNGNLYLLFFALSLSITVVVGLMAFTQRVESMLSGQSKQFLAADQVLVSSHPIPDAWLEKATLLTLKSSRMMTFRSMLYYQDNPLLVSIKAVDDAYPLLGSLVYRDDINTSDKVSTNGPSEGDVWLDSRLFYQLGVEPGDTVEIGDAVFTVRKWLIAEPDAGAAAFSFSPRVLMHRLDVDKTGIIQEGSRLSYRYLLSGQHDAIARYIDWLSDKKTAHQEWQDLEKNQPAVATALKRAQSFFLLATSVVVILACFAIAMTSLRYSRLHIKQVALLKTLGLLSKDIGVIYGFIFIFLLFITFFVGSLLGYVLQELLIMQVAEKMHAVSTALTYGPWFTGFFVALISLLGFALPPLLQLKKLPAVEIFRQNEILSLPIKPSSLLMAIVSLGLILYVINQNILYSTLLLLSLSMLIVLVALPTRLLMTRLSKIRFHSSSWLTLALTNLKRHLMLNAIQISAFASCLMLMVVLWGVKDNLFQRWQSQLPDNTPNYFLLNLQSHDVALVESWLASNVALKKQDDADEGIAIQSHTVMYPMVRGRLVSINDEPVLTRVSKEGRERASINRELSLSWTQHLPQDNRIVAGRWFDERETNELPGVSVESLLAERLNISLGDTLGFSIAGKQLTAEVASLREVQWDRMRPNFFMLFEPSALEPFPASYMTSFYLDDKQQPAIQQLLEQVPTAMIIDLDAMIKQIRGIIKQVSQVLTLILVFVLVGCLLVLVATVQSSITIRNKENAIIRAIGGSQRLIQGSLLAEFIVLGAISGLLATLLSELVLQVVQVFALGLPWGLNPDLWVVAPMIGILLITTVGYFSARKVVVSPPDQLLRQV